MARKLRLQFPGAIYHVMNRGDRREDIYRDDQDRERFIETLAEVCSKASWQVHAYCLMRNHFHLVIETPEPNLVAGMKWLLGTYTMRFNRRHGVSGHLFAGRYRSQVVEGGGGYLRTACDYVHLNPTRAGIVKDGHLIQDYRWSSVPAYLVEPNSRPMWMRVDRLLGECGIPRDSDAGRRVFEQRLECQRMREQETDYREMRGGWCIGDDQFRQELLTQVSARVGAYYYGSELNEAAEARANRIVAEELEKFGWAESSLPNRRKGAPEKVEIARRLRQETTMTLDWIAERLGMGAKGYLSHLLYWYDRRPLGSNVGRGAVRSRKEREVSKYSKLDRAVRFEDSIIPRTDPSVVQFDTSFD